MGIQYSTVELLLDMGANINSKTRFQNTPLTLCDDNRIPIARLLIERGVDIESVCEYGNTPFAIACMNLNHNLASLLLESGTDVNHVDKEHVTPLMVSASSSRHQPIMNLLLYQATANIHAVDRAHCSLLEYAMKISAHGFLTVQALINMGMMCEKKELQMILPFFFDGQSSLHVATADYNALLCEWERLSSNIK
jgi:death-associated protein kinase